MIRRSVIVAALHNLLSATLLTAYLRPAQTPLPRVHSRLLSSPGGTSFSSKITTTMAASAKPVYDVVVFGATSFAGSLLAEYYLTNYGASPPAFKWALAARSETKLADLKARLSSEVDATASTIPTIIADSMDDEAIERMVSQAKVILTTVGPYGRYGSKLVASCARAGVHCCDLTGESPWVREMIDKHHAEAERTGAKIVPSCGFDSIPADMGTLMMVDHMKRVHGVSPDDVRYYFAAAKGGISGGTVASILDMCEQVWAEGSSLVKKMNDPLLLAPQPSEGGVTFKKVCSPGGLGYDSGEKSWTAKSLFASHDSKVVYRSGSILGYPDNFRYTEVSKFKGLFKGFFPAVISSAAMAIGGVLLVLPFTRKLIARSLPAPGEGPSKEDRDSGFFWIDYLAKAQKDGKEVVSRGKVGSDKGDCGYKETAKMLGECGLCLALDEDRIESKAGGVLTTATAMGMPLIERMRKAGMTFKILDE